ncbi:hypothetical protein [Roseovarius pacificus]|uniref:hypothetical protein n=1 Tax=Roseovarius pacificus TaxID=337701 RepID=UPI00403A274C
MLKLGTITSRLRNSLIFATILSFSAWPTSAQVSVSFTNDFLEYLIENGTDEHPYVVVPPKKLTDACFGEEAGEVQQLTIDAYWQKAVAGMQGLMLEYSQLALWRDTFGAIASGNTAGLRPRARSTVESMGLSLDNLTAEQLSNLQAAHEVAKDITDGLRLEYDEQFAPFVGILVETGGFMEKIVEVSSRAMEIGDKDTMKQLCEQLDKVIGFQQKGLNGLATISRLRVTQNEDFEEIVSSRNRRVLDALLPDMD